MTSLLFALLLAPPTPQANAADHAKALAASQQLLHAWLRHADPKTLLLPDRVDRPQRLYTPHNSGADLYPYLIITARLTDPALYHDRMMEMLRNEIRYTNVTRAVPGNLDLGLHVDAGAVQDPSDLAHHIRDAFTELVALGPGRRRRRAPKS